MKRVFSFLFLSAFTALPALADEPDATLVTPASAQAAPAHYSYELSYADAEEAVSGALVEKGAGQSILATIGGHSSEPLFSYNSPVTVELRGLQFEKASGHWNASLLFMADGKTISAMPVAGHYDEAVQVPVLKRQIRHGDLISDADIDTMRFPVSRTRADTITDPAKLVGLSPAQTISPNRPIREHEIAALNIMKKGAIVQMRYQSPGIAISTTGQTISGGAAGDVIAVRNMTSHKIVRAVIEDAETVSVATPAVLQSDNLHAGVYPYAQN